MSPYSSRGPDSNWFWRVSGALPPTEAPTRNTHAITGASSGIGEAAARLLASQGAHVVLGARRIDRLEALTKSLTAEGGSARCRQLDVTRREEMEAFVEFALGAFGRLDVLINNAGVMPLSKLEALKWTSGTG